MGMSENKVDYEFTSNVVPVPGAQTAIWVDGGTGVYPAGGRTTGRRVQVLSFSIHNVSGSAGHAWIETAGGVLLSIEVSIDNDQTIVLTDPINLGDQDVYVNADVVGMSMQISGKEM